MALFTLEQIRAVVRFRGDYQNVKKFPNADVNTEIQGAFGAFWELIADTHEGYWDTFASVSTVADQAYVAMPAGTWRVLGLDILEGDEYTQLAQIGVAERNRYGSSTDQPLAYRLTARGADLYPTPNGVYTLRVVYTPSAPALQEAGAREWYNGWEDFVVTETLRRLDERERKPLNERIAALKIITDRVKAGASFRKSQEPEYLNLHEYGGPFDRWEH